MADWTEDKDAEALFQKKVTPKGKTVWKRFVDSVTESALHNPFGAEGVMRKTGLGRPEGLSDEELNRAERAMSEDFARSREADDAAWEDVDTLSPANIGRKAVELVGGLVGGIDPTYVLGPGRSVAGRIAAQAGINAGMDAASQGVEVHRKVRDKFDPWQTVTNAAAGALFQGGGEVISHSRLGNKIKRGSGLIPDFNRAVDITIHSESRGNDNAVSRVGAKGKMQVMPGTLRDPGFGIRKSNGTKADDARVGRQYLAVMIDRYHGDMEKVWAAYNWGPGNLDKALKNHGEGWFRHAPKETRNYVTNNVRMLGGDLRNMRPDIAHAMIKGEQKARDYETWAEQNREMLGSDDDLDVGPYLDEADNNGVFPTDEQGFSYDPDRADEDLNPDVFGHQDPVDDALIQIEKDATEAHDLLQAGHITEADFHVRMNDLERRMSGIEADGPDKVVSLPGAAEAPVPNRVLGGQQWSRGENGISGIADAKATKLSKEMDAQTKKVVDEVDDTYWTARKVLDDVRSGANSVGLTKERAAEIRKDMQQTHDWLRLTGNQEALKIQKDLMKVWDEVNLHLGGGLDKNSANKFVGKGLKGHVANEPGNTVGAMTGKQIASGIKDPVLRKAMIKAIDTEDKYNTFVGWGNGPGVPEPKSRNSNAYKAWKKKHDALYEAKEKAAAEYEKALEGGDAVVTDGRGKATHDSAKKFIEEYAPIRDPANDMGGEPVSKAVKPDVGNARGGNDNVPGDVHPDFKGKTWYHGTNSPLDKLEAKGPRDGIALTDDYDLALAYAKDRAKKLGGEPHVIEAEVAAKNPVHVDETNDYQPFAEEARQQGHDAIVGPAHDGPNPPKNVTVLDSALVRVKKIWDGAKKLVKDITNDEEGSFRPFGRDKGPEGPDGEDSKGPFDETVQKIISAITATKPLRKEQTKLHREERERRLAKAANVQEHAGGEAGYFAELKQLKGDLPKVNFESIRDLFTQSEVDKLFDIVRLAPHLSVFDKITARTGLLKILGEPHGAVPTNSELTLLGEVFPKELVDGLLKHRSLSDKIKSGFANALNIPRSVMASFDLSAPLRQGVAFVGKKAFWKSFAGMFRLFGSERAFQALQDEITARPTYRQMRKAGLSLTGTGKILTEREEAFMSEWAERIPVLGRGIKASNRAYVGFLNKLRADVFDDLFARGREAGIDFRQNPKALKDLGRFINAATGRGDLGKLNTAAPLLNSVFFSPRLMASRISMLNPMFYANLDPYARKEALKSMLAFSSIAVTTLSLAAMGGADVETDPRSSDFGKIKVGKTRYDILGGFQQYIKLGAQLITGETKNATSGVVTDLTAGKYGQQTRLSVLGKFLMSKESPVASFVTDMLEGKDQLGRPVKLTDEIVQRVVPLLFQDTYDAYMEYGAKGLLVGIPGMFGIGINTYRESDKIKAKAKTKQSGWETVSAKDAKDTWGDVPEDEVNNMFGNMK